MPAHVLNGVCMPADALECLLLPALGRGCAGRWTDMHYLGSLAPMQYALKIDGLLVRGSGRSARRAYAPCSLCEGGQAAVASWACQTTGVWAPDHLLPTCFNAAQWALKERGVPPQLRNQIVDFVQVGVGCGGAVWMNLRWVIRAAVQPSCSAALAVPSCMPSQCHIQEAPHTYASQTIPAVQVCGPASGAR